ncbi:leucine-rich repeat and transmembrane domain-containing protein 2 [Anopheles gambiae]|uniref:LRRCT domain-containing protein n=3 Tax=gambiae species complex TaxID=44542 RepID=A0A1S4G9B1_ANOGA|nr:leucine-rich repeat and transmembrane domain-containing protein 2-like [Anopheles coluzzii]XP_061507517.1 leucine-rich repeat and transmembrane domain-containing protein 2 [Anopheles gambiae]
MRASRIIIILLASFGAVAPELYEDAATLCDRCACVIANRTSAVHAYDLLDCSRKGLTHMIGGWPARFDTVEPEREIVLSLSGNNLTRLEQLPATNTTLVFSCRHCNLGSVAGGLFLDTANVLRVDLSHNRLTGDALTAAVFRGQYVGEDSPLLLQLDELDLGANAIAHLQEDAFEHIVSLRELSLARNPLGRLAGGTARALAQLVNLEHLDLSYAELTELDESVFGGMRSLHELNLRGNRLGAVPEALYPLAALHTLNLAENPIEVLSFAQPLDYLFELNVSSMPVLHTVEVDSFAHVRMLRTLLARNNTPLEVFDMTILHHLTDLRELDLSQSKLKHLHPPTGSVALPPAAYLNVLEILLLHENPWHCDCALQKVLRYIHFFSHSDYEEEDDTRCETPHGLAAMHLVELYYIDVCDQPEEGPAGPTYEKPAFLRPGAIFLSLLSVGIVVGLGIIIGLVIVCLKRRLAAQGLGFTSAPVRYTSVRESTTSTVFQP